MVGKSSIDTLPEDVRTLLNRRIAAGEFTVDDLTEWLEAEGYPRSRSAIGRHKVKVDKVAERLKESREMAQALAAEVGEDLVSSKQGRMITEIFRNIVWEQMTGRMDDQKDYDPQELFFLAKAIKDVAGANRLDQDYEKKVREQISEEIKKQAADQAETAARSGGASEDQVAFIRARILGITDQVDEDGANG